LDKWKNEERKKIKMNDLIVFLNKRAFSSLAEEKEIEEVRKKNLKNVN